MSPPPQTTQAFALSDPDLFEVAQQQGRTLVTYNRVDYEPIIREYAETVHPTRFPSSESLGWLLH
jgi:hypothetical protein